MIGEKGRRKAKGVEKDLQEFYASNSAWLEDVTESPDRPKILRVMASLVLKEAEKMREGS